MAKDLDIVDRQLELGMVKTITTGSVLNYVELLFNPNIKSQFYYDEKENAVQFCVKDSDLDIEGFSCYIDRETLRSLIIYLKTLHNQLKPKE